MRKLVALLALALASAAAAPPARAQRPRPPAVPLAAYLIVDDADGHVLAARDADAERAVASLTKLMTAYIAERLGVFGRRFTVSEAATEVGESSVAMRTGQVFSGEAIMEALLVHSANNSAVVLADGLGGSVPAFVARMNATARRLGLRHTAYRTPNGLDAAGQHSSARDVMTLARLVTRDPRARRIVRMRSIVFNGSRYATWNTLLGVYPGIDGVKTGHTSVAGWNIVVSATQNGHRLYVAALGAANQQTRDHAVRVLLDWAFAQYRHVSLAARGARFGSLSVPYGGTVPVVAAQPLAVDVRAGEPMHLAISLTDDAVPPLRQGAPLGHVDAVVGGRTAASTPLVAGAAMPAPAFLEGLGWLVGRAGRDIVAP